MGLMRVIVPVEQSFVSVYDGFTLLVSGSYRVALGSGSQAFWGLGLRLSLGFNFWALVGLGFRALVGLQ